ncbi:MAG TPA: TIGR04282 family arsenosugar biosynthesis glycosyltransferase [Gemmataceae bacterium]|nr:TIGR04282 family arsenosugar biosynthesis glycosyltransferase [Gemmataceae bacterium]
MTKSGILLVFVKFPEPGKVKTRLADELGTEVAAAHYREWIGRVLRNVQPTRESLHVVGYFDGATADRFSEWNGLVDNWRAQPAGDLGTRLADGFEWGHRRGQPVIAIGTDCLDLTAEHVESALQLLRERDAVFGPTTDGGYYLVGTRTHVPSLFDAVRWSSPHTLADNLERCQSLGLRFLLLDELADIDTAADWREYQARSKSR